MHYAAFCIVVWPIFRERVASPAVYRQLFAILLVAQLRKPLAKPSCPGSAAVCNSTSGPTERFACKTQLSLDRQLFAIPLVAQLKDRLAKNPAVSRQLFAILPVAQHGEQLARLGSCLCSPSKRAATTAVCTLVHFMYEYVSVPNITTFIRTKFACIFSYENPDIDIKLTWH
jgi:hypothetical protein